VAYISKLTNQLFVNISLILLICMLGFAGLYIWLLITSVSIIAVICISRLFPLFTFPVLTGKFAVGTILYHLKDQYRRETHEKGENTRELLVQIWYPAISDSNKAKAPYMPEVIKTVQNSLKESKYAPLGLMFTKFFPEHTQAIENATISPEQDKYPVIIFSHGLGGVCNFSTVLVEELASHGYIVIGVNHTYSSYVTVFPDGRIIKRSPELDISVMQILKENSSDTIQKLEYEFNEWVLDVQFVLRLLEDTNSTFISADIRQRLNLEQIGMYGHSFGGALAAELCRIDTRCKAGISLDGAVFDKTLEGNFKKPFMFIVGALLTEGAYPDQKILSHFNMTKSEWDTSIQKYKDAITFLCTKIGSDGHKIIIKDAGHFAFTDISLLKPFWSYLFRFDIGATRQDIIHETNRQVIQFFDKYLKN
jgi:dienelactone hydrolase